MSTDTPLPRTRLSPDQRRAQLLDLGVRLLATRSIDELSIDLLAEEAGISRGLLYHYFGNKHAFHEAVVRRAAADLVGRTAPPGEGDAAHRLLVSLTAYVDYVDANYEGYLSLVRGAASGSDTMREVYEDALSALTDRIFEQDPDDPFLPDTPAARLLARGWAAMVEEVVLTWKVRPQGVSRAQLLHLVSASLPALAPVVPPAAG